MLNNRGRSRAVGPRGFTDHISAPSHLSAKTWTDCQGAGGSKGERGSLRGPDWGGEPGHLGHQPEEILTLWASTGLTADTQSSFPQQTAWFSYSNERHGA